MAFERYLYDRNGGKCWGALDWNVDKFSFRMICEPFQARREDPLRKLGALLLAARAVANGDLGLYIGQEEEIELPFCGIQTGDGHEGHLLKCYHFDRFTRLSFCRQHEFELNAEPSGSFARFEWNWMALAALSEFILERKNARATRTTCTRLMQQQFTRCFHVLSSPSALGHVATCRSALDYLTELLDEENLTMLRTAEPSSLLNAIGIRERPVPADYALRKMGISSAERFWEQASAIVDELYFLLEKYRYDEIPRFTVPQMTGRQEARIDNDISFLADLLRYGHVEELQGNLYDESLRRALAGCLLRGGFEIQHGQLADIFFSGEPVLPEKIEIISVMERRRTGIPVKQLFPSGSAELFQVWYSGVLQSLAEATFSPEAKISSKRRGGRPRRKDNPPRPRNYRKLNFPEIVSAAEKLWEIYSRDSRDCLDRWLLSLKTAEEILARKAPFTFRNHYRLAYREERNQQQYAAVLREKARLLEEFPDVPKEELIVRVAKMDHFTITDIKAEIRHWVMMAVLVKLMVRTATVRPEIWNSRDTVFSFVTHILCATMEYGGNELCFPFHIGIFSDAFLRLGRTRDSQANHLDRIVEHRYSDAAEREVMLILLAGYLKECDDPAQTLAAVTEHPAMRAYFDEERLFFLKHHFTGGEN